MGLECASTANSPSSACSPNFPRAVTAAAGPQV